MNAAHKRRDWIKVRSSWWTSPNHQLISFGAKAFGLFLLHLADSDPEWRSTGRGRVLGPSGVALRLEDGCRMVGVRSRDGRRWVAELRSVGTLCEDESGTLYFPNYREHQEDSSARRKRRSRKGRDIHRDSHASCHASVTGEVEVEVEAEVEEQQDIVKTGETAPAKPARPSTSATSTMASVEQAEQVAAWVGEARRESGIAATNPRVTPRFRKQVKRPMRENGATLDDWRTVIRRQAASCDREAAAKYLTVATLSRPENFGRLLERDDLDAKAKANRGWADWGDDE